MGDQNIFVTGADNMTHIYIWTCKIIMVVIFSSHAYCSVDIPMPKRAKGRESPSYVGLGMNLGKVRASLPTTDEAMPSMRMPPWRNAMASKETVGNNRMAGNRMIGKRGHKLQ